MSLPSDANNPTRQPACNDADRVRERWEKIDPARFPHKPEVGSRQVPATIENLQYLLRQYGISVRYNVISKELAISIPGHVGTVDNFENSTLSRVISLCRLNGMRTSDVPDYLYAIGDLNLLNPVEDYITSKPWDGVSRLPDLYATVKLKEDFPPAFRDALLFRWLLSTVAAATMRSGFRSRGVLTFQGPQGIGKTRWLRALIDNEVLGNSVIKVDHHLDGGDKDSILSAIGHWLVELGELESSLRKDVARLKGFITADFDKVRRPYDRKESKYPRRTVFMATVNDLEFLVDPTGNSRFWVIPVIGLDYNHGIDMQQVFAELYVLLQAGEQWWLTDEEEAMLAKHNRDHRSTSAVKDKVMGLLDLSLLGRPENKQMSATEVLEAADFRNPTNAMARECGSLLRELGITATTVHGIAKYRVPLIRGGKRSS
ncbi:VapE domain-containing protein [Sphingoaurantiacus capsulatus]|uniref:VapE domain-containing protein n=1 Tax=Sphingoaurantiacus capsulatus TaxID=1771310 RepID=A0ABV7XDQ5_9SPHN